MKMNPDNLEKLFSDKNFKEIIKYYEKFGNPEKDERFSVIVSVSYLELGLEERNSKGNDKKALDYFQKSLEIKEFPDTHNHIGLVYFNGDAALRDLIKAEEAFNKSLEVDGNFISAILNKGLLFQRQQKFEEAITTYLSPFKKDNNYDIDPKSEYFGIAARLISLSTSYLANKQSSLSDFHIKLLQFMVANTNDIQTKINAADSFRVCLNNETQQLINKNIINNYFLEIEQNGYSNIDNKNQINLDKSEPSAILRNEYIKKYLNSEIVNFTLKEYRLVNYLSEKFLSSIRSIILKEISKNKNKNESYEYLTPFLLSLSKQSYMNDYCWFQSKSEDELVNKIYSNIIEKFRSNIKVEMYEILIVNSYKSLFDLKDINEYLLNNFMNSEISDLIELQITNRIKEEELGKKIENIARIKDKTSLAVKKQYEQNPYPRWEKLSNIIFKDYKLLVSHLISPNKIAYNNKEDNISIKNILIAGCGTGKHPIELAMMNPSLKIDALDISLASLSYGVRKAKEMNIENIRWLHGDILELQSHKGNYDAIESVGVIHHMKDPLEGFKILERKLKSKGIMKLGLYSKISKQKLEKSKKFLNKIKTKNKNLDFIREVRNLIGSSKNEELKLCMKYNDFYNSSEFRDLLLHEQEHFTSILEIKKLIANKFNFLGFQLREVKKNKIIEMHIKENIPLDFYSLDFFNDIEILYNDLFDEMYNFYIMKK